MKSLLIAIAAPVAVGLMVTKASADPHGHGGGYYYPRQVARQNHARHHDDLEHRAFHRELYHREAHRYPMTWRQHDRLHDHLDHEAFHDHLEHRAAHRSGAYYPRTHYNYYPYGHRSHYYQQWQRPYYGFRLQGRNFSFSYGY